MELYAFLKNSVSINRPNFFHFVGIHGKQLVQLILKHKFEINDFIKRQHLIIK